MNKVIKLSATWCGPCKQYAPIFNEVVDGLPDTWESLAVDIDTDEGRELMIANGIRSVPTTMQAIASENNCIPTTLDDVFISIINNFEATSQWAKSCSCCH